MNTQKKIGFISLGCPKALVDSEHILTRLQSEGYQTAATYDDADLVIINTCGFIDAAIEESMETINEALAENGKVIVTGCLGAKKNQYGEVLVRKMQPKVLEVTGPNAVEEVVQAVHKHLPRPHEPFIDLIPPQGIKLTPKHYAYIKISEGCNHNCTFCIIPSLRGKLKTRSVGNILQEAEKLFDSGVKELLVVSQDTGAYGMDVKYQTGFWEGRPIKTHIVSLTESLGKLAAKYDAWIRLHYIYPYPHIDQLVDLMKDGLVLPYLDVPLQHAHPAVLKRMKRPANSEKHLERIESWRKKCPDITIRSTFITGFPGETQKEFEYLLDFLKTARIDKLGCFPYSSVDGAAANQLKGQIPEPLREERRKQLMLMQEEISRDKLQKKIGKTFRVLLDQPVRGGAIGRSFADAPEIDGIIHIKKPKGVRKKLHAGEFVNVKITETDTHDMWGELIPAQKTDSKKTNQEI